MTEPVSPTAKLGMTLAPWDGAADIRTINSDLAIIDAAFGSVPGDMTIGEDLHVLGTLTVDGATTLTGNTSTPGRLTFTGNAASGAPASVFKNPLYGLILFGATGSTADLALENAAGALVAYVPAGTQNLVIPGGLAVQGNLTVTGTTTTGAPGDLIARQASVSQSLLGDVAGHAGVLLGNPGDTNLYRQAADILKTDDALQVTLDLTARLGVATQVLVGGVAGNAGLAFGSAGDVNLYRFDANTLKTDDGLVVAGASGLSVTGAAGLSVTVGPMVLSNRLSFAASAVGVAGSVYRDAAGGLVLWGVTGSTSDLTLLAASGNSVLAVPTGTQNVTVFNTLLFGAGGDTNLYRSAANTLKTDDALVVAGVSTLSGGLTVTGTAQMSTGLTVTGGINMTSGTLTVNGPLAVGGLASLNGGATVAAPLTAAALSVTPGDLTVSGGYLYLGPGPYPALVGGLIRMSNNYAIAGVSGGVDVSMMILDNTNRLRVGQLSSLSQVQIQAATTISLGVSGAASVVYDNVYGVYPSAESLPLGGASPRRWAAVWAVNGTIQTSSRADKRDLTRLDPTSLLGIVRATEVYSFRYAPTHPSLEEVRHVGFVAEDVDALLSFDGRSANPQTTASVALGALRGLDEEMQALAARVAALEAAP